jgi:hypothetical protein
VAGRLHSQRFWSVEQNTIFTGCPLRSRRQRKRDSRAASPTLREQIEHFLLQLAGVQALFVDHQWIGQAEGVRWLRGAKCGCDLDSPILAHSDELVSWNCAALQNAEFFIGLSQRLWITLWIAIFKA